MLPTQDTGSATGWLPGLTPEHSLGQLLHPGTVGLQDGKGRVGSLPCLAFYPFLLFTLSYWFAWLLE